MSPLGLLLGFTFLNSVYQTLIISELRIGLPQFDSIVPLVLSGGAVCFGAGNAFAGSLGERATRSLLRWGGPAAAALILVSLAAALLTGPGMARALAGLAAAFATLAWFGVLHAAIVLPLTGRAEPLARAIALSLLAAFLGFVSGLALTSSVGANAGLALAAVAAASISSAVGARAASALALASLLAALGGGLDARLERLRPASYSHMRIADARLLESGDVEHVLGSWSPAGRLDIYRQPSNGRLLGLYNYRRAWSYGYGPETYGGEFWKPGEKNFLIGIGAGGPLAQLRSPLEAGITGVELNAAVVAFFRRRPELNGSVFEKIRVLPIDGRAALDRLREKQDRVIYEFVNTRTSRPFNIDPDYLFTREAIDRVTASLKNSGSFIVMIHNAPLIKVLLDDLARRGFAVRLFRYEGRGHALMLVEGFDKKRAFVLVARRGSAEPFLPQEVATELSVADFAEHPALGRSLPSELTDERPYLVNLWRQLLWAPYWSRETAPGLQEPRDAHTGPVLIAVSVATYAALLFLLFAAVSSWRARREPSPSFFFFAIGAGFVLLQLSLLAKFRALLDDPMTTMVAVNAAFFVCAGLGGLAAPALLRARWGKGRRLAVVALALLSLAAGLPLIPFAAQSPLARWAALAAIVSPIAFAAGTFYPAGLALCRREDGARALLFDALGAFCGFVLFFLTSRQFGISFNLLWIAACYLAAAARLETRA